MPFLVNRSYCLIGGLKLSSWPIGVSEWDARLVFGPPIGQLEAPVQWTGDIGEPEGPDACKTALSAIVDALVTENALQDASMLLEERLPIGVVLFEILWNWKFLQQWSPYII